MGHGLWFAIGAWSPVPTTRHDRLSSAQASMEVETKDSAKEGEWWAWWNERIRSCQS